jgi:hypothetical protein
LSFYSSRKNCFSLGFFFMTCFMEERGRIRPLPFPLTLMKEGWRFSELG